MEISKQKVPAEKGGDVFVLELEAARQEVFESNRMVAWLSQERQNAIDRLNRYLHSSELQRENAELRAEITAHVGYIHELETEFTRREDAYWNQGQLSSDSQFHLKRARSHSAMRSGLIVRAKSFARSLLKR